MAIIPSGEKGSRETIYIFIYIYLFIYNYILYLYSMRWKGISQRLLEIQSGNYRRNKLRGILTKEAAIIKLCPFFLASPVIKF